MLMSSNELMWSFFFSWCSCYRLKIVAILLVHCMQKIVTYHAIGVFFHLRKYHKMKMMMMRFISWDIYYVIWVQWILFLQITDNYDWTRCYLTWRVIIIFMQPAKMCDGDCQLDWIGIIFSQMICIYCKSLILVYNR